MVMVITHKKFKMFKLEKITNIVYTSVKNTKSLNANEIL